jgi:hypothetical protein
LIASPIVFPRTVHRPGPGGTAFISLNPFSVRTHPIGVKPPVFRELIDEPSECAAKHGFEGILYRPRLVPLLGSKCSIPYGGTFETV